MIRRIVGKTLVKRIAKKTSRSVAQKAALKKAVIASAKARAKKGNIIGRVGRAYSKSVTRRARNIKASRILKVRANQAANRKRMVQAIAKRKSAGQGLIKNKGLVGEAIEKRNAILAQNDKLLNAAKDNVAKQQKAWFFRGMRTRSAQRNLNNTVKQIGKTGRETNILSNMSKVAQQAANSAERHQDIARAALQDAQKDAVKLAASLKTVRSSPIKKIGIFATDLAIGTAVATAAVTSVRVGVNEAKKVYINRQEKEAQKKTKAGDLA